EAVKRFDRAEVDEPQNHHAARQAHASDPDEPRSKELSDQPPDSERGGSGGEPKPEVGGGSEEDVCKQKYDRHRSQQKEGGSHPQRTKCPGPQRVQLGRVDPTGSTGRSSWQEASWQVHSTPSYLR